MDKNKSSLKKNKKFIKILVNKSIKVKNLIHCIYTVIKNDTLINKRI